MWNDDEYPSVRTRSAVKVFPMEKLIDSEEFDLGVVDVADLEMELAELGLTPPQPSRLAILVSTGRKAWEPRAMPDDDDAPTEFLS
jgi:hypothetical protein